MKTEPMFVSADEFMAYTNKDLSAELKDEGTPYDSNKVNIFLVRIEDQFLDWCDANMGTRIYGRWEDVKNNQDLCDSVKKAIIQQVLWVWRNGDTSTDSGYDPQKGVISPLDTLREITIAPNAIDIMKNSGLYSHRMANRRRYGRWH